MNSLLRNLALIAFVLVLPSVSLAQPFVVKSDNAKFYDAIRGTKVISDVPKNTPLYGLERKELWVKAVDPKTQTVAWISWKDHLSLVRDPEGAKKRREIVKKEREIVKYGIDSPVTSQQLRETLVWLKDLRDICGDLHPVTRAACMTTASIMKRAKDRETAEIVYDKALEISLNLYGKKDEKTADVYLQLAYLYVELNEYAKAAKSAKSAIMIYGPIYGFDHTKAAECWVPLAHTMARTGEYESALKFYTNAANGYAKTLGEFNIRTINIRDQIANCHENIGNVDQAIATYETILIRLKDERTLTSTEYKDLVKDYSIRTKLKLATLQTDTTVKAEVDSLRVAYKTAKSKHPQLQAFVGNLEQELVVRLLEENRLDSNKMAFEIFDADLKDLRTQMRRDLWNIAPEKQDDYLSVNGGMQFFRALSFAIDNKEEQSFCQGSLEWLINAKGMVREAQAMQAGSLTDLEKRSRFAQQPIVRLAEVTKALPEDGVYVDIIRYLDHDFSSKDSEPVAKYAAWIAKKNGQTTVVELGSLEEIDRQVINLKALILKTAQKAKTDEVGAFADIKPQLSKVTRNLWEPIRSQFGEATTVVISPDHTLWLLPWSAMLNPDGKYAIEKYQIQLELSGRDLIRKTESGKTSSPVVFADPDFGPTAENQNDNQGQRSGVRIGSFAKLNFSAKEAGLIKHWISQFLGNPIIYSGRDAVEEKFKSLRSPSILVMSTHGYYLDESGKVSLAGIEQRGGEAMNSVGRQELRKAPLLKCGLVLTDGNKHTSITRLENDGVLTGLEIAQADLRYSKLAVLSACQTGVGTIKPTAGVIGMRSAFHAAGVQCVVTTLWPIPDEETVGITNSFFRTLADDKQVRSSLHLAQKDQIEKRRRLNGAAHPYFWAAFNVSGQAKF